jgi:mono/diheme cytochrome c family protein
MLRPGRFALAGLVAGLTLAGCGGSHPPAMMMNFPQPIMANAVQPGDPLFQGQYLFLQYTWGGEMGSWPTDFVLSALDRFPDVFGKQFEKFGFIPDPADDLPYGFKRGNLDPTRVSTTCATCHTGRLPDGRPWFGEPNTALDTPALDAALDQIWMADGNPSHLSAITTQRAHAYGPGRFRIDSDGYKNPVAANIPVHFNLAQRTHLTTVGGALDVRSDVYLSVGSTENFPIDASAPIQFPPEDQLAALIAFMGAQNPPPAPAQDAALVAAGRGVFTAAHCDGCHHPDNIALDGVTTLDTADAGLDRLPGVDAKFPNGSVHADREQFYMAFGSPSSGSSGPADGPDPQVQQILQFASAHSLRIAFTDGYVAPNLHGLWASAPYLNNGSVPTLADLLASASARPKTFMVGGSFVLDTTQPGNGNQGHEFGTDLSASDKTALIAYLNSL